MHVVVRLCSGQLLVYSRRPCRLRLLCNPMRLMNAASPAHKSALPLRRWAPPPPPGCCPLPAALLQLEKAATVGAAFVVVLAGVFIHYAVAEGLPAIASGELPIFKPAVAANLPEAVGVLSFA